MTTVPATKPIDMKYRSLGGSGLLVSRFAFGCLTFERLDQIDDAYALLVYAFTQSGINFWDTAEGYAHGVSEQVVGQALARGITNGVWTRDDIVVSTKLFFGTTHGPNAMGLSRKHLVEGMKGSLTRLALDYVDVVFCHRLEAYTPMEEIVRTMDYIITQGWACYWGTSDWDESDILKACEVADRLGMTRPIVEQQQYNLLHRAKVDVDFQSLYAKYQYGIMAFSPLAFGILTGKHVHGVPPDSRMAEDWWKNAVGDIRERVARTEKLRPIAAQLDCSLAQLAIAWCVTNENVTNVLLGAKTLAQLQENLAALAIADKITPEIKQQIDELVPFAYQKPTRDFLFTLRASFL